MNPRFPTRSDSFTALGVFAFAMLAGVFVAVVMRDCLSQFFGGLVTGISFGGFVTVWFTMRSVARMKRLEQQGQNTVRMRFQMRDREDDDAA
jgi:hypothetical protein